SHYDGGLLWTLGGRATTLLGRFGGTIRLSRPYTFSVAAAQPPSTFTHAHTPNHVNQFTRPSIIRARSPLRHHGDPTPAGTIPVTPVPSRRLLRPARGKSTLLPPRAHDFRFTMLSD
ncbi:hypothetical protein T492DRAFT_948758, partial [Pavlovales sp. CCMP2436]